MKKTVQIVTVPLNVDFCKPDDLVVVKQFVEGLTGKQGNYSISNRYADAAYLQSQQLLVLSDDEVQRGIDKTYWKIEHGEDGSIDILPGKKVIAMYPHDGKQNTLPLSKETVQAWIDAGTPDEGSVEMIQKKPVNCSILNCEGMRNKSCDCFDEKWKIPKLDSQGNLLLEFGQKKKVVLFPESLARANAIVSKLQTLEPSIPTDDEIYKKADAFAVNSNLWGDGDSLSCLINGYENGYKQALKDLGHIK